MTLYDELVARGLVAQVTDEEEIKDLINNGKATFYIGFDPTADSLHVGHFMALNLMRRMQRAGAGGADRGTKSGHHVVPHHPGAGRRGVGSACRQAQAGL